MIVADGRSSGKLLMLSSVCRGTSVVIDVEDDARSLGLSTMILYIR